MDIHPQMEGVDVIDLIKAVLQPGIRQEIRAIPQHGPPGIFLLDGVIASERGFGNREQQIDLQISLEISDRGISQRVPNQRYFVAIFFLPDDFRPGCPHVGVSEDIGLHAKCSRLESEIRDTP